LQSIESLIEDDQQLDDFITVLKENKIKKSNENENVRMKRRLNVFMNVYNKCRLEKGKEKDYCLYLANLYQTVKGFHGF
jgi:hypothetical protein